MSPRLELYTPTNITPLNQATGLKREWTYHPDGGVKTDKNEKTEVTTTRYDALGRISEVEYPDHEAGVKERIQYRTYTKYNLPETVTGADTYPIEFGYDLAGNRTTMTDAKGGDFTTGAVTTWEYDERNRVEKKIYDDLSEYAYTYDEAGALKTRTDAESQTTTYLYGF